MTDERKHAILFAATILAARKLNESGSTPWAIHVAITDGIDKANLLLERLTSDGQQNQVHLDPHAKNLRTKGSLRNLEQGSLARVR